ncbi:MAG: OmpA family protein [Bacteroidetes bacterium]|nr:OmpA family protein [Bacteroidota bacterium]
MKKLILTYCFFIMLFSTVIAQHKSNLVKLADNALYEGNYYHAIELFSEELQKNEDNPYALQQLALTYQKIGAVQEAHKELEKLFALNHKDFQLAEFQLALSFKSLGNYEKAKEHFDNFRKTYKGNNQSYYTAKAKDEMKMCVLAATMPVNANYIMEALPSNINKRYSELSPTLTRNNLLIYSTLLSDTLLKIDIEAATPKSRLYAIKMNDSTSKPELYLPLLFKDFKGDISDIAFSEDGNRMYFTECKKNEAGKQICVIYAAANKGENWGIPVKIGDLVNDPSGQFTSTHPALGWNPKEKNDLLYFTSDRPGGNGGLDIWSAEIDAQFNVEKAANLGRKFNSTENEITPFIDPVNGNLYFSSNGFESLGGYDIMVAADKGKSFDKPKNMGKPFNSSLDDFYFRTHKKNAGFLVSNRTDLKKNNCCDDVFRFYKEEKKYFTISALEKTNDSTEKIINNANIVFYLNKDSIPVESGKTYTANATDSITVVTRKKGYLKTTKTYTVVTYTTDTFSINVYPEAIAMNKEYNLNNLYFDYGKTTLTKESINELEQMVAFMNENPELIIEIAAHTDNKGAEAYNLKLSQTRAKSVADYLIEKGIAPNRLVAKGYGSTQPIALNTLPDGTDNPEGRQQNRRIIFKVTGQIK